MKELSSEIIKSEHSPYCKMSVHKYNSKCFYTNSILRCDSVVKTRKERISFSCTWSVVFFVFLFGVVRAESTNYETSPKCPNCRVNDSRAVAILNLQGRILEALGYHDGPPKNSFKERRTFLPLISKFVEMYKPELMDNNNSHNMRHHPNDIDEQPQIQLQEELSQGEPCSQCMDLDGIHTPMIFRLENSTGKSDNWRAVSLMLFINNSEHCPDPVNINIHQLTYPAGRKEYKIIKSTAKEPDRMSWIYLDVTNELQNHMLNPTHSTNITFVIDLSYKNSNSPGCPDLKREMAFHAVLKFQYNDTTKKRSKRTPLALQDCRDHPNYTDCCRHPLVIDFDELQWDFIITPRRYEAYHCSGECPLLYKHSIPHTHLVEQMKKGTAGPCCSPKKMNSITMLYFTPKGTILFGKVAGMVVETCGCS